MQGQCVIKPDPTTPGQWECLLCGWRNKTLRERPPRRNCGKVSSSSGLRTSYEVERLIVDHCEHCDHYRIQETCDLDRGCQKNTTRQQWLAKMHDARHGCPLRIWNEHVDVLYGINAANQEWVESKASVPVDMLTKQGISAIVLPVYGESRETIVAAIERNTPCIVVNCALFMQADRVESLATQFPEVQWVSSSHCSQSDLARNPSWLKHQFKFVDLARRLHNCHYALVDERTEFYRAFDCPRLIHLNNCVSLPDVEPHRGPHDPPVVSLICEWRPLKNIPNQLIGLALARKQVRFRVLLAIKNDRENFAKMFAQKVGLDVDARPWQSWTDYLRMVALEIDVGLQASFTESFNFVALDHLLAGKPVIGSPAIRFLPKAWQANPDDPRDISRRLLDVLSRYSEQSNLATTTGRHKARESNALFISTMRALISKEI